MKLKSYFEQEKSAQLSDYQKIQVYEKFLWKKEQVSFMKKISFYSKVWVYSLAIFFLLYSFYNPYLLFLPQNSHNSNDFNYIGSWIVLQNESLQWQTKIVKANSIWTIIETQWDFTIKNGDQEFKTNLLYDGDTVLLANNTVMTFLVNSWVTAQIQWPAEFSLDEVPTGNSEKKYVINLISGKFIEVKSEKDTKDNVIVKTTDIEVESKKVWSNIDFKITSWNGDKKILENKWDQLIVKQIVKDEKQIITIWTEQKAEINEEEVKLITEVKQIAQALKDNNLSQTFEITGQTLTEVSGLQELSINYQNSADKSFLDPAIVEKIRSQLIATFVMKDIENMVVSHINWDTKAFIVASNNFVKRIQTIYDLLWIEIDSQVTTMKWSTSYYKPHEIYAILDQLIAKSEKQVYLPPKYIEKLKIMLAWTLILQDAQQWASKDNPVTFNEFFDSLTVANKQNLLMK